MTTERPAGTTGYDRAAAAILATRLPFEDVHRHISHLFPAAPARILDVGSGPGHDAARFAEMGHEVTAVEPTPELRQGAVALYGHLPITWVEDALPDLASLGGRFDFILLEGVWAHLTAPERALALPRLAGLLAESGVVAISLRHGPGAPGRIVWPVTAVETQELAEACGLVTVVSVETGSIQPANVASGVTWTRMAFRRV